MRDVLPFVLLIAGFCLLIQGASWLVRGASALAAKLRVPDLVIGLTVVAFGTSAPELLVSAYGSARGYADIAIGNVLGSNTFNTLLILGVAALIRPLAITDATVWKEIPLSLLAAVLVGVMANDVAIDAAPVNELSRVDGIVNLAFFIVFLFYVVEAVRKSHEHQSSCVSTGAPASRLTWHILLGFVALGVGARWVVQGAVDLAERLGASQALIGLTVVSAGTSLPELATSTVAAWRGNADIAVGNVVGSNIFNIFLILGSSALIHPLAFEPQRNVDIGVTVLSSALLFAAAFTGRRRRLDRWEGGLLVGAYAVYLTYLVARV